MDGSEGPPDLGSVAAALRKVSATQGFNAWLGVELLSVERGVVKVAVSLRPDLTQHHGFAHGGVVGALADTACAWAAASVVGDVVTGSYTLQFLAPARGARLAATASVIRAGRRSVSVEARITSQDEGGEETLVAVALASIHRT